MLFRNGRSFRSVESILAVGVKVDLERFSLQKSILISFILKSKPLGAAFSALAFISRVETGGIKVIGGSPPMSTAVIVSGLRWDVVGAWRKAAGLSPPTASHLLANVSG